MLLPAFFAAIVAAGARSTDEDSLIQVTHYPLELVHNKTFRAMRHRPRHEHLWTVFGLLEGYQTHHGFCFNDAFDELHADLDLFKDCEYYEERRRLAGREPCSLAYESPHLFEIACLVCARDFSVREMVHVDSFCPCCTGEWGDQGECNPMGIAFCNRRQHLQGRREIQCHEKRHCTCEEEYQRHIWRAHQHRSDCLQTLEHDTDAADENMTPEKCHEEFTFEFMDDRAWHAYCDCEHRHPETGDLNHEAAQECKGSRATTTMTTTTRTGSTPVPTTTFTTSTTTSTSTDTNYESHVRDYDNEAWDNYTDTLDGYTPERTSTSTVTSTTTATSTTTVLRRSLREENARARRDQHKDARAAVVKRKKRGGRSTGAVGQSRLDSSEP